MKSRACTMVEGFTAPAHHAGGLVAGGGRPEDEPARGSPRTFETARGSVRGAALVLCCAIAAVSPAAPGAPASPGGARSLERELAQAARKGDAAAFLAALDELSAEGRASSLRAVLKAYDALFTKIQAKEPQELFYVHGRAARHFGRLVDRTESARAAEGLLERERSRAGRLLLLDMALFSRSADLETFALRALESDDPVLVRRALRYLARSRKPDTAEAVAKRYLEVAKKRPRKDRGEWDRALLAFEAALESMLKVELNAPEDWASYVAAHKNDPDLFDPRRPAGRGVTRLTLFGAKVSGDHIVFVLDVSGSMKTTDPFPPEALQEDRGRTIVGDDPEARRKRLEERMRITRAKRELEKVVRALPPGKSFNIIAYSSEVKPWRRKLVRATPEAKKEAVEFIRSLKAEGITVTDLALEEAFSDLSVDTIYLITDGAPTHVGSQGPGKPPDADRLIEEILERVRELNFLRDVRIFTLGFEGAEEEFLQALSREHGGRYVRIR